MEKRKFDKEFKTTIVSLLDSRKSIKDVCFEYELNDGIVRRWSREFTNDTAAFKDEATLVRKQKIKRLKKQLKDAKEERIS